MSQIPRFRLDRELGLGTTGRVWHGILLEPCFGLPEGASIAVKYLRPELEEDPRARRAFEAEAEAGQALDDDAIVRVYYVGADARGRFLVMPYVPGETLRAVMERSRGGLPEPLVRTIARAVARGLAALHEAGFTHGDVKPENIRLDAEGRAVLLDLGFARRISTSDSRLVAPRPGSLPYVAPEQARGEIGSVASDVFALGVVLYELCTGAHPFAVRRERKHAHIDGAGSSGLVARAALDAPEADRMLAAIATARFVPPSRLVPQLSPFIDRLLEVALARDPARRPSAHELSRRFEEQEAGSWWRAEIGFDATARRGETGEPDPHYRTPLVGREQEMSDLVAAYTAAVSAHSTAGASGGSVWVRGTAGSGKTRLINEFAARVRASATPPLYLYGRCRELEEERPAGPFLRMLEHYLRLPSNTPPGRREKDELEALVPPRTAETLCAALDPSHAQGVSQSVPLALATWLTALARRMPVIVNLDDASWAGPVSLAILSHIADQLRGAQLLVVVCTRDDHKARDASSLEAVRERFAARGRALTITLKPLDEAAVLDLVARVFHHTAPQLRLAHVLWQRSRGNPGLIVEILRGLIARGEAQPHSGELGGPLTLVVSPDDLPLPGSLRRAIADSYRALPARDRMWLRRLAVVGGRIETEFLTRAFKDEKAAAIDEILLGLSSAGWLSPAGARWRFARPALREAVYRSLTKEQRLRLHAAAAEALRPDADRPVTVEDAFQRAFHLRAAEDHAGLLEVLPGLLERLLTSGQPQRVHPLAQWGLAALAKLPTTKANDRLRIELLEAAADASDRLGIRADQRNVLDQLADLEFDPVEEPKSVGRVYLLHARYAVSTGQYGLARGMLRNAVEMFTNAGAEQEMSDALRRQSLVQSHVGELIDARKLAQAALKASQTMPQKALAHLALGVIDVLEDRTESALANTDSALTILRSDPSFRLPGVLANAYLLRARIYRSSGTPGRAIASAKRAMRLAHLAGERRLEAEATARLGGLLLDVDRAQEAQVRLREALLLASEIEDRRGQALARLFLGILLWEIDDPEAPAMLSRAAELAVEMGLNRVEALAAAIRSRVFRANGDMGAALEWSARAMNLLDRFGAEMADRIAITGTRALILTNAGEGESADELVRALRERLKRETARIRSPLHRLRHRRVSERLLEAVLSSEGPLYPRVTLDESLGEDDDEDA
ncbi:MAG: protein kinase [Planctomycetes bacterium]|nr:protein kinase [Planctomycetota bacterium]